MKILFKKLSELNKAYHDIARAHPEVSNTKFGYAYSKFYSQSLEKVFKSYNVSLNGVRCDSALTDKETKEILFDNTPGGRGFKYDKLGLKAVVLAESKLEDEWFEKEFEVEPFIAKEVPEYVSEYQMEMFEGLLVPCKEQPKKSKE